ncbi:YjzC family protein [Alicyclobacillus herbarius]|uniref:YjzC family protein n=1 Tax=Alicyclobacillus herbarius TaxID=122960 RepID=UPI0003FE410E
MAELGQHKQFEPGWEVPNDGFYIEVGEHPDSASIRDPQKVYLKRGDTFPETSNGNRKWVRMKNHNAKD